MDGVRTRQELAEQVEALTRRVDELEALSVEHRFAEKAFQDEVEASVAALKASEATAIALLESASDGIVVVDEAGRITLVNSAAERMFGYSRAEMVGAELEMLIPERVRKAHVGHRARYFAAPKVRPMGLGIDLSGRRRDGTEFPMEISLSYVKSGAGTIAMAFVTDITARKRGEAELRRQQQTLFQSEKMAAVGRLAAGVAHEMNNPLGIISSRIEVMLLEAEDQGLPPALIEDLHVLHRNTQRAATVARGLRSFARQSPREHLPVDINAVVDESLLLTGRSLGTDGIEVAITLDRTLPLISADAGALHQVLLNLLTNAREAMGGGGKISIDTRLSDRPGHVRLIVRDTGPGIPPDHLPRIFDPFFTTKPDGTGLGLSMSYGIIQDHHGTVDVESTPGQGTTFVLTLPVEAGS